MGAIMRAALSEPGSELEVAALACADAVLQSMHSPMAQHTVADLLKLDPFNFGCTRLPLIFKHEYLDPHYPRPQFGSSRFAVRFVEFKFSAVLNNAPHVPSCMLYLACLDALFPHESLRNVIYFYLPLNSPLATDLFRRLMAKHEAVRYTCERLYSTEFDSVYVSLSLPVGSKAAAYVLGVNLGIIKLDLGVFGEMLTWPDPPRELLQDMVRLSATLVDDDDVGHAPPATKPRFDFNRPGAVSCTDWRIDRLLTNVLRMEKKASDAIMANLLRCRRFAGHDPRYVALSITSRHSSKPSCAEVEFCTEWMRSQLDTASWLSKERRRSVLWLFRKSTPTTAPQAWTLLLMLKGVCGMDAGSLGALSGIYNPFMSDAAIRCLVWNHPLAATRMIYVRERHHRILGQLLSGGHALQEPLHVANSKLAGAEAVAQVVRCVGGSELCLLFGSVLPLLARMIIKSFLM